MNRPDHIPEKINIDNLQKRVQVTVFYKSERGTDSIEVDNNDTEVYVGKLIGFSYGNDWLDIQLEGNKIETETEINIVSAEFFEDQPETYFTQRG